MPWYWQTTVGRATTKSARETEVRGGPDRDYKISESHWRQVVRWKDQSQDYGVSESHGAKWV